MNAFELQGPLNQQIDLAYTPQKSTRSPRAQLASRCIRPLYSCLGENPAVSIDIPAASILRSATHTSSSAFPSSNFLTRRLEAMAWNECVNSARSCCSFMS